MNTEIVYLGHDNVINLVLKSDGVAVDLQSVTGMNISLGSKLISSSNGDAEAIRWAKQGYAVGEVRFFLAGEDVAPLTYWAPLVVYDGVSDDGIVWGFVPIKFVSEVEAS